MRVLLVGFSLLASGALLPAQSDVPPRTARPPVIRAISYEGFQGIQIEEILQRFKDRGVQFGVERVYSTDEVEAARKVLQALLKEKGRGGAKVKSETTPIPPRSVRVVFTALEP